MGSTRQSTGAPGGGTDRDRAAARVEPTPPTAASRGTLDAFFGSVRVFVTVIPLGVLSLALGCGQDHSTRLTVVVESDLVAPSELDAVEIVVDGTDAGGAVQSAVLDLAEGSGGELPARVGVTYAGGGAPLGPLHLRAIGRRGGEIVAEAEIEASFVLDRASEVRLYLSRGCVDVTCPPSQVCVAGACEDRPDGGAPPDGGGPVDAGMCPPPFDDCTAAPGCETNLASDSRHCGGCFSDCRGEPNVSAADCVGGACGEDCLAGPRVTGARCAASACEITSCDSDYDDCNLDASDGCETNIKTTPAHCNECGRDCATRVGPRVATTRCESGNCLLETCEPGFFDCDEDEDNGCECASGCRGDSCM